MHAIVRFNLVSRRPCWQPRRYISKKRKVVRGLTNVKKKMTELCVLCGTGAFLLTSPLPRTVISIPFPKVESWSPSTTANNIRSHINKRRNVGKAVHEAGAYRPSMPQ